MKISKMVQLIALRLPYYQLCFQACWFILPDSACSLLRSGAVKILFTCICDLLFCDLFFYLLPKLARIFIEQRVFYKIKRRKHKAMFPTFYTFLQSIYYKRILLFTFSKTLASCNNFLFCLLYTSPEVTRENFLTWLQSLVPVSYTHLTLPTTERV